MLNFNLLRHHRVLLLLLLLRRPNEQAIGPLLFSDRIIRQKTMHPILVPVLHISCFRHEENSSQNKSWGGSIGIKRFHITLI
jgi:hypothetical protein